MRTSTLSRSVSASLATKCLAVAATPPDWMPLMSAAPVRPVSSGSSEKHSKCRPPSGERCRFRVGARSTSTPLRRASAASSAPRSVSSRSSQEAASAVGEGSTSEVSRSSHVSPRTPAGPSERVRGRSPTAGSEYVRQVLPPVSRRTFCAASSFSSSGSISSSVMTAMPLQPSALRPESALPTCPAQRRWPTGSCQWGTVARALMRATARALVITRCQHIS